MRGRSLMLAEDGARLPLLPGGSPPFSDGRSWHSVDFFLADVDSMAFFDARDSMAEDGRHPQNGTVGACRVREWSTMAIYRRSQTEAVLVGSLRGFTCLHRSIVRLEEAQLSHGDSVTAPVITDADLEALVIDELIACHSRGAWSSITDRVDLRFAAIMGDCIRPLADDPYLLMSREAGQLAFLDASSLAGLLKSRAALGFLDATRRSIEVGPRVANEIETAMNRVETAMGAVASVQALHLDLLAQRLSAVENKAARGERQRDRTLARLGAVTLFPMLILSLMGTNILPEVRFPFYWHGLIVAPLTLALCIGAAAGGLRWVMKMTSDRDMEDVKQ